MKLSGRERLLYALNHKEGDCVPIFDFLYSRPLYKEVLGHVPVVYDAENIVRCSARIGYDFVIIPMGGSAGFNAKEDSGNIYTDEWGITYRKDPCTWPIDATISYPMLNGDDWKKFTRLYKEELLPDDRNDKNNKTIRNHGQKFPLRLIARLAKKQTITLMCHCDTGQEQCHLRILEKLIKRV